MLTFNIRFPGQYIPGLQKTFLFEMHGSPSPIFFAGNISFHVLDISRFRKKWYELEGGGVHKGGCSPWPKCK